MATNRAPAVAEAAAPPQLQGKKKLVLIVAAVMVLLALGGGGVAFWAMKKNADAAAAADGQDEDLEAATKRKKGDKHQLPVFLPMDLFTVNLADRDAERYAQVGVTLELADAKTSDLLKAYMPAVRNDVLMLIAHKKAAELQDRAGKVELAREIRRAALKPLDDADVKGADEPPVRAVHFSSFIIQ
jgi:flagellar FliL protein